jgi:hypothetical protein
MADAATSTTTASDVLKFLDYAEKKGLLKGNTAAGHKAAAKKVLSIEGDLDKVDVRALDLDMLFQRFENLHKDEFTPGSLQTYRGRVRQAISWYLTWSANPSGWMPPVGVTRGPRPTTNGKPTADNPPKPGAADDPTPAPPPAPEPKGRLIDYPFPLREGVLARLFLPADLKRAEVRRLTAYMATLAVDGDIEPQ